MTEPFECKQLGDDLYLVKLNTFILPNGKSAMFKTDKAGRSKLIGVLEFPEKDYQGGREPPIQLDVAV